jgi:LuxR family transcriptional regulator, maltose regulon positive regulatory protein
MIHESPGMDSNPITSETAIENWIPQTKLTPDMLGGENTARPELVGVLDKAICSHRLTLLSSPPGYGKSTLLSLWAQAQVERIDGRLMRVAWLSLDASENDRTHFLLALIASLQTLHPKCGHRAKTFLTQNGYPEPIDAATLSHIIGGLIIIDIMQYVSEPFALVLDSYQHVTESGVHEALDYLIRRLPPNGRVVISTTRNPPQWIARLRAYGLLAEFHAEELAYTEEECATFVRNALGSELRAQHAALLFRFTEGWPAGIRMAVEELQLLPTSEERARFLAALWPRSDDYRHYSAVETYFEHTIYRQVKPQLRRFLLQTSVLHLLDADRCKVVTGMSEAVDLLDEIVQRNLFVVDNDANGAQFPGSRSPSIRYHRSFASFLQGRLQIEMPDQVCVLHKRAAEVEDEPIYRIEHLIMAGSWYEAAEAIQSLLETGEFSEAELATAAGWIARMPDEVRYQYSDLIASVDVQSMPEAARAAGLTERQFQVLKRLATDARNKEIADDLVVSLPTVKGHVSHILRTLDADSRHEAVRRARELGILSPE